MFYSPGTADSPEEEHEYAKEHFFMPVRVRDPRYSQTFDTESFTTYDKYDLLVVESHDPFGGRITVGERDADPTKPLVQAGYDYRLLAPVLGMDANRNRVARAYDILGTVVAIATMGKPGDARGIC